MEDIPHKFLISKGNVDFDIQKEGDLIPTIQLECYEYIINKDEDGSGYYAVCEELHANTQGDTWEELKDNIFEVHSFMLEDYD